MVPLEDKDANKKEINIANTLKILINLQEEMATNFNNFLGVQRTHTNRKNTILSQSVNTSIKIATLIKNISIFVKIFHEIYVFQTKFVLSEFEYYVFHLIFQLPLF